MLDQGHIVGQVAKILHIKEEPIWEEVRKHRGGSFINDPVIEERPNGAPTLSRPERIMRIIEGTLLWQGGLPEPSISSMEKYRARFEEFLAKRERVERTPQERETLIFEAEARWQGSQDALKREIDLLFKDLEEELIRNQFIEKMGQLKQAERDNNHEEAGKLLAECQMISERLHSLMQSSI